MLSRVVSSNQIGYDGASKRAGVDGQEIGMAGHGGSRIAVIAALIGNLTITVIKFIAAAITGSSAMISEGIH